MVTGDFIDGSVAMRRDDVAPLRDLRAPDGVFAIPGNHEYFFDYPAWMRHLAGLGLTLLPNAHAVLARGEARLVLAGVTDASAPAAGEAGPDLAAALAGAPPGAPVVLLDHQPRAAKRAAARGVALQLSGHTHGGMILASTGWWRGATTASSRALRRRRHDPLCRQRHRDLAGLRAPARPARRDDPLHPAGRAGA